MKNLIKQFLKNIKGLKLCVSYFGLSLFLISKSDILFIEVKSRKLEVKSQSWKFKVEI